MRRFLFAFSLCLACACAASSKHPSSTAPAAPAAPPPAAELARSGLAVVADAEVTLTDAARKRDIAVDVTYPGGPGPFPVVVYSHGDGGSGDDARPLARFWATRGYVVLAPSHRDPPSAKNGVDPKAWEARARDLAFLIDSLPSIGERVGPLAGKLDGARVGVGGHSYGAYTAGLLAGATIAAPKGAKAPAPKTQSFADPRPKAFLLLSPPGAGIRGWTDSSWSDVARPLLLVTGSRDGGPKGKDSSWRLDAFRKSPPGDKFYLFLRGASHLSFTGRYAEPGASLSGRGKGAPSTDEEVAIFKDVKAVTVAFWDEFLRNDSAAKAFLSSSELDKETGGRAKLERR
jgi:predicted dienelactone hydrolase